MDGVSVCVCGGAETAGATIAPQLSQNFAVSGNENPHLLQFSIYHYLHIQIHMFYQA